MAVDSSTHTDMFLVKIYPPAEKVWKSAKLQLKKFHFGLLNWTDSLFCSIPFRFIELNVCVQEDSDYFDKSAL